MVQGIYIVANNHVQDAAIALLTSIRLQNPDTLVYMIPFDENYEQVAAILGDEYDVKLFPDLKFIDKFIKKIASITDSDFLLQPHKLRKLALWFGSLDRFIYIDTDIIVFEDVVKILEYLEEFDFVCCDYQYKNKGLKNIFTDSVKKKKIFTDQELEDVFNSGFWASKKGLFTELELYNLLKECVEHKEYFDFSEKVTDQPILNYLILKFASKRLNLVKLSAHEPGSWAGSPQFKEINHILYDGETPLKYIHWAGFKLKPGFNFPYKELWEYYRYLGNKAEIGWQSSFSGWLKNKKTRIVYQLRSMKAKLARKKLN